MDLLKAFFTPGSGIPLWLNVIIWVIGIFIVLPVAICIELAKLAG